MTETSKAQTGAEQARMLHVASLIEQAKRGNKSLSQARRGDLARIMLALGRCVSTSTTKTEMVDFIQERV